MTNIIHKDKYSSLQREMAHVAADQTPNFALLGGTALSWFYLKHRMSYDLDFFAARFEDEEVKRAVQALREKDFTLTKVVESREPSRARYVQYKFDTGFEPGLDFIKIDFVEDVHDFREITKIDGFSVYTIPAIYFRKILIGSELRESSDITGRVLGGHRQAARDLVDLYYLSNRFERLSVFFGKLTRERRLPHDAIERFFAWLRRFPRQDFIEEYLAMDLSDRIDPKKILAHLDAEVDALIEEQIGEI